MIWLYSPDNTEFDMNGDIVLLPEEATVHVILGSTWEASLTHPIDEEGRWAYIEQNAVVRMPSFNGSQLWRIVSTEKSDSGITATMQPIFYDCANEVFFTDIRPTNKSAQAALDILMEDTKYSGTSDITVYSTAYYEYVNLLEALMGDIDQAFVNRWGGEAVYDNFTVEMNAQAGADNGVEVRYGKNIPENGLTITEDMSDVVTRIYPKGYDGVTMNGSGYVDSDRIDDYPTVRAATITFDYIYYTADMDDDEIENLEEDDENVLCATQDELDAALTDACESEFENGLDLPAVTIEAEMVLLQNTEQYKDLELLESVSIGDTVHVYNSHLNFETSLRVIELEYNSLTEEIESVKLGDFEYDYFSSSSKTASDLEDTVSTMITKTAMQQAIDHATKLITGNSGGYIVVNDTNDDDHPDELLVMNELDIEETTKLWRLNLGGFGYSSTGYDGNYETAITMDGAIVADFITTGKLVGGVVTWDLDTGELVIGASNSVTYTDSDGTVSTLASEAQAEAAAATATNYLYYSTATGLIICDDTDEIDGDGENSVRVTASGISMYTSGVKALDLSPTSGLLLYDSDEYIAYFSPSGSRIGRASADAYFLVDDDSINLEWSDSTVFHAGIGDTSSEEEVTITLLNFSADDDSGDYTRYALTDGESYGIATTTGSESTAETYSYYVKYGTSYYCASTLPYSSMKELCTELYDANFEDSNELATSDMTMAVQSSKPYYTIGTRNLDSIGGYSTTIGYELEAAGSYQTVIGKYNEAVGSSYLFVIGGGTKLSAKNVFTVTTGGKATATTFVGDLEGTADYASALEVSGTIGGTAQPVYINSSGVPKALSKTVGSSSAPVYLSSGTVTECSNVAAATADALTTTSVGSSSNPVYINSSGVPVACDLDALADALDIDVDASGDYLPLTGGELTGELTIYDTSTDISGGTVLSLYGITTVNGNSFYALTDGDSWGGAITSTSEPESAIYVLYFNEKYYYCYSLSYSSIDELCSAITDGDSCGNMTLLSRSADDDAVYSYTKINGSEIELYNGFDAKIMLDEYYLYLGYKGDDDPYDDILQDGMFYPIIAGNLTANGSIETGQLIIYNNSLNNFILNITASGNDLDVDFTDADSVTVGEAGGAELTFKNTVNFTSGGVAYSLYNYIQGVIDGTITG